MLTPEIKCPKCNEMGVVKTERDDSRRPDRYSYRISHPAGPVCRLAGKDRDIVLKLLGRYIPKTEEKRAYVGRPVIRCPICNENGSYAVYDGIPMVCHYVKGKGTIQHRMRTTLRRLQAETAANKQIITQKDQIIAQKNQKIEQLQRDKAEERAQDLKFFQSMHERTTNYLKKKMERQSQAQ